MKYNTKFRVCSSTCRLYTYIVQYKIAPKTTRKTRPNKEKPPDIASHVLWFCAFMPPKYQHKIVEPGYQAHTDPSCLPVGRHSSTAPRHADTSWLLLPQQGGRACLRDRRCPRPSTPPPISTIGTEVPTAAALPQSPIPPPVFRDEDDLGAGSSPAVVLKLQLLTRSAPVPASSGSERIQREGRGEVEEDEEG